MLQRPPGPPDDPHRKSASARQRRSRARRRRGIAVLRIKVPEHALVEALQLAGRVDDAAGLERARVEREVEQMVADFITRWSDSVTRGLPK